jgi:threonine aldolase
MAERTVDLRSDTTTRPTDAMREAMEAAEVGDDAFGEDPTVNRLQDLAAAKLGMEAAVFVPTGTMGNGLALLIHTEPGDTVLCHERSHLFGREPFHTTSGIKPKTFAAAVGVITPDELTEIVQTARSSGERPSLLSIENSHNYSGGYAWLPEEVETTASAARDLGLKIHMDGARIFNSCIALRVDVRDYAKHVDSVMFCVSKGLSAPVGSLLCGSADFIEAARKMRSGIGGTMRQAGIVAAAGIVALETMVDRLAEDHEHARLLFEGLKSVDGISARQPPNPTNFVMADAAELGWTSSDLSGRLAPEGVLVIERPPKDLRLVLQRHLGPEDVDYTVEAFRRVAAAT